MNALPPRATRPSLASVVSSQSVRGPLRAVIHGEQKIGKSTFAAGAPNPIFVSADDGLEEIDAKRFDIARTFGDVLGAIQTLTYEPHDFETVVIDHGSAVEPMIHELVCQENNWLSIETPSFQKGYHAAQDKWRDLLSSLDRLREKRGMHAIVIVQTREIMARPKNAPEHGVAVLALHHLAASSLRSWSVCTLFADLDSNITPGEPPARVLRTSNADTWQAGNRYALPPTMPLDPALFWREVRAAQVPVPDLIARARRLAAELGGETPREVESELARAGKHPWELLALCRRVQDAIDRFYLENAR